jgi:hypothetical protein
MHGQRSLPGAGVLLLWGRFLHACVLFVAIAGGRHGGVLCTAPSHVCKQARLCVGVL